ncbi:MAG TPA: hypothetical protein VGL09_15320 [Methylomirabilota bacterium]
MALAVLVMLPRLASPQFGLLDDGLTLQTGREVAGAWSSTLYLIPETGRFFPAYWLAYSIIVTVVGARPLAFFAVNALLLAGLLALLARLIRHAGGTPRQAAIAAVVFAVSGPAIETFYTLSKAEGLQMAWIAVSLLATAASTATPRRTRRAGLIALAAVAMLLADATKETGLVLIPISLGWLAIDWWLARDRSAGLRFAATYVVVNLVAGAAFAVLRWSYAPLALGEGTYTRAYALDGDAAGAALFRIASWLVRDFAFLLPLLVVAALSLTRGTPASRRLILYISVWMAGWLAVYVPWPATFEYYLLPFSFGAAALAGTLVGDGWTRGVFSRGGTTRRAAAWSVLAASALLWLGAIVNAVMDARVQLTVDRANADLVDFLGALPGASRIVLNTRMNEYFFELPLHLTEIKRRSDVVVEHVAHVAPGRPSAVDVFVLTPELANRPLPTVRVALDEPGVRDDHAMLTAMVQGGATPVYRSAHRSRLAELGIHRLLCRVAARPFIDYAYCPSDRPVLYRGTFSYGWQVHRLSRARMDRVEARRDG